MYVSVPNRFSLKDQNFNLYFVNWLPRSFSDTFISIFGKYKDYSGGTGHQRLKDMYYYTFSTVRDLFESFGSKAFDIRELKIRKNLVIIC